MNDPLSRVLAFFVLTARSIRANWRDVMDETNDPWELMEAWND